VQLTDEVLIPRERIAARVAELGREIAADRPCGSRGPDGSAELSVLCVMDGAFMFCADLVRELPLRVNLGFARVCSVERGGDPDRAPLPADLPVRDADLLVVEDVLDTGQTLARLLARLEALGPRRLRCAVLLDKPARRRASVRANYVGFAVEDRWVVGYGLDHEGRYRNLPYVSYVK
jgi:hypoxanthine phosphoribosyltransferase